MNLQEERNRFKQKLKNPSQKEMDDNSFGLALFSANVKKFLPLIDKSKYEKLFKDYLYFYWMSGSEQYSMEYLRSAKIVNHSSIDLKNLNYNQPLIFSSFHFGSFRLFNSFLFERGHKIVIIIDDTIVKEQKDDLIYKVMPLLNAEKGSDFVILSVQDRSSIFKLKKLISEGYIMTVYLDGNMGVGMKRQDFTKSFIPINFLDQEVYVKNGISKLSFLLNAKIVPVISYRDKEENSVIEFHQEIGIESYKNKQEFLTKSMEDSYKILEGKIRKYPSQWTSWTTLQDLFMRNYSTPYTQKNKVYNKFNDERYSLFVANDSHFIFDLLDYQSYPIEKELAILIKKHNFEKIKSDMKLVLQQKNIII
jgi:lauroyl/myristoyl acyltransferase